MHLNHAIPAGCRAVLVSWMIWAARGRPEGDDQQALACLAALLMDYGEPMFTSCSHALRQDRAEAAAAADVKSRSGRRLGKQAGEAGQAAGAAAAFEDGRSGNAATSPPAARGAHATSLSPRSLRALRMLGGWRRAGGLGVCVRGTAAGGRPQMIRRPRL